MTSFKAPFKRAFFFYSFQKRRVNRLKEVSADFNYLEFGIKTLKHDALSFIYNPKFVLIVFFSI